MMPLRTEEWAQAKPGAAVRPDAMGVLNHLRFIAMTCRAKPRADLFEACALLHVDRSASLQSHSEALMRCLGEALGKPARLLAPGEDELTFDEHWLVHLCLATTRGDAASIDFLLKSRVGVEHRRLVRFLVQRICGRPGLA